MMTSGFTVEQRRFALWAVEAGWSVSAVCRAFGVTRVTYYRWKAELAVDLPAEGRAVELASRLGPPRQLHVAGELAFVREAGVFSRAYQVPGYRVQDHAKDLEARVAHHRCRHRNDIAASLGVTLWQWAAPARVFEKTCPTSQAPHPASL